MKKTLEDADRQPASKVYTLWLQLKLWIAILKYPILFLIAYLLIIQFGQGAWVALFKWIVSLGLSIGIVYLIASELWRNKSRLNFVQYVYFQSGWLTYVRAMLIFMATATTMWLTANIVPEFMHYGWAQLIFGHSTNVAFQPLATINEVSATQARSTIPFLETAIQVSLTLLFWLLMIFSLPFLAEIEEKIFRQGVHTWTGISINSLKFGLVHLIMGIPLFVGFVLFVPGFLFACRYKYAYRHHFRQSKHELAAQAMGVRASTADHAVYNALIVTVAAALLLLPH